MLLKDLFLEKLEPKYYYYNKKSKKYVIYRQGTYYLTCNTKEQAENITQELKKNNWNKDMIPSIRKKYGIVQRNNNNLTGFYRTYITKDNKMKNGYRYVYQFQEDGLKTRLTSSKLSELRKKVLSKGMLWKPLTNDAIVVEEILKNGDMEL